jgi:hypothetical protein
LRWVDQQIKRAVPINDERPPAEIFGVIKEVLPAHCHRPECAQ